jgi:hypothetical protein
MGYGGLRNDYEQCRLYCSRSVHSYFNIGQLDCGWLRRIRVGVRRLWRQSVRFGKGALNTSRHRDCNNTSDNRSRYHSRDTRSLQGNARGFGFSIVKKSTFNALLDRPLGQLSAVGHVRARPV